MRVFVSIVMFFVGQVSMVEAQLEWAYVSTNLTVHPLQASVTVPFHFTNKGTAPVEITELKPGCGCISGEVDSMILKPGAKGTVQVTFDLSTRLGAQRKGLEVRTKEDGSQMLYISTHIAKTYEATDKRVIWKSGEARGPKSCRLKNRFKEPIELKAAVPSREGVEVELKTIREGVEYELMITPAAELKNVMIPIKIHPVVPEGVEPVRHFTVYALLK